MPVGFYNHLSKLYDDRDIDAIWAANKEYRDWVDITLLKQISSDLSNEHFVAVNILKSIRHTLTGKSMFDELIELIKTKRNDDDEITDEV